jgi:hypothetical protein
VLALEWETEQVPELALEWVLVKGSGEVQALALV